MDFDIDISNGFTNLQNVLDTITQDIDVIRFERDFLKAFNRIYFLFVHKPNHRQAIYEHLILQLDTATTLINHLYDTKKINYVTKEPVLITIHNNYHWLLPWKEVFEMVADNKIPFFNFYYNYCKRYAEDLLSSNVEKVEYFRKLQQLANIQKDKFTNLDIYSNFNELINNEIYKYEEPEPLLEIIEQPYNNEEDSPNQADNSKLNPLEIIYNELQHMGYIDKKLSQQKFVYLFENGGRFNFLSAQKNLTALCVSLLGLNSNQKTKDDKYLVHPLCSEEQLKKIRFYYNKKEKHTKTSYINIMEKWRERIKTSEPPMKELMKLNYSLSKPIELNIVT